MEFFHAGLDENPPQFTSTPNTSSLEEVNPYASSTPLRIEVSVAIFSCRHVAPNPWEAALGDINPLTRSPSFSVINLCFGH